MCIAGMVLAALAASVFPEKMRAEVSPAPSLQGYMVLTSAEGHAPNEPAWVTREQRRNFQRWAHLLDRQLTTATKSCRPKPVYARWTYHNGIGTVLWKYVEQVYFCYTGRVVTYFYRYRWAELPSVLPWVDFNPWKFDGNIDNSCGNEHCFNRGYRAPKRVAMTRGQFEICGIKVIGVCNYQSPVLTIVVYGDGSHDATESGG